MGLRIDGAFVGKVALGGRVGGNHTRHPSHMVGAFKERHASGLKVWWHVVVAYVWSMPTTSSINLKHQGEMVYFLP